MRVRRILTGVVLLCFGQALLARDKLLLTVEDAVSTRRIAQDTIRREVALSPDGTRLAYIVKAPDLQSDTNNYELYVRDLAQTTQPDNGHLLFRADDLLGMQWLGNSKQIGVISKAA